MNPSPLLLVVGLFLCFGGWVVLWLGSRLIGIALGMGFGFVFGTVLGLVMDLHGANRDLVAFACAALGAFGGIFFIRAVSAWLFSLLGFLFGMLLARLGYQIYAAANGSLPSLTSTAGILIVGVGIGVALLTLWLRKYVLILVTSFMGATFLCAGVEQFHDWLPGSFFALFVSSIFWQTALIRFSRRRAQR